MCSKQNGKETKNYKNKTKSTSAPPSCVFARCAVRAGETTFVWWPQGRLMPALLD